MEELIALLREQIILLTQQRFGASSEKLDSPQISLFDEAEVFADATAETEPEAVDVVDDLVIIAAPVRKGVGIISSQNHRNAETVHNLSGRVG